MAGPQGSGVFAMLRYRLLCVLAVLTASMTAVSAADWSDGDDWGYDSGPLRGPLGNEPKDWAGLGDEADPLGFEFGLRYWYSWGAHGMTVLGDNYSSNDTSHIVEAHGRIDDHSSGVYLKGLAGHSAIINASYSTPTTPAGASQGGRILYAGADVGYAPLRDGETMLAGFAGYQYWNDSPDMGQVNFIGGSLPNDINFHMLRLGISGRIDFGGVADVTAEVAAIPYAPVWGTYGAFDGSAAPGNQTSAGNLSGWLYGAAGEVMARFRPHENWAIGLGGRAWYLTGNPDVTFSTDNGGGTNYITGVTQFSTFRYGLLGEVNYKF